MGNFVAQLKGLLENLRELEVCILTFAVPATYNFTPPPSSPPSIYISLFPPCLPPPLLSLPPSHLLSEGQDTGEQAQ